MTAVAALRALSHEWRALLLLAVIVLLPVGRAAELPLALAALIGTVELVRGRAMLAALPLALFAGYWLPELLSAFDAVAPDKAWTEVAADLRYLPLLAWAPSVLAGPRARAIVLGGSAAVLAFWLADALLQATTGLSLGGPAEAERLTGIFGADDPKLGGMLAVLSPFLLWPLRRRPAWLTLAFAVLLTIVLLAGVRAAWLTLAVVVALLAWQALPRRRAVAVLALALCAGVLAGLVAYQVSERFAARVERSAGALAGDQQALDHALSYRLPIWRAAVAMIREHPINGVGVRGFRYAYPEVAPADDYWRHFDGNRGAFHAHQWLLEVLAETGLLGLACWLAAIAFAWRAWFRATPAARQQAVPATTALLAALFPLNTHYAVYSSEWGGLLIWLAAVWLGLLAIPKAVIRDS